MIGQAKIGNLGEKLIGYLCRSADIHLVRLNKLV